jgi:replicative DNA helicase
MPEYSQKRNAKRTKKLSPVEDELGRLQPQAVEVENAVLGTLMLNREAFAQVCEILVPDSFYDSRNQIIFTAIRDLALKQMPIDMLTVKERLKQMEKLEEVGGVFYIAQLTQNISSVSHLEFYARIIQQKYMARQLISIGANITEMGFDETRDIKEVITEAEGEIFKLAQSNSKNDFTQINPVIDDAYKVLKKAAENKGGLTGIASGFTELDKITNGWQNSDLVILAARPAMGKTAFALSMAKNMAIDNHKPVAFFSLEMSNVQLVNRLISNVCEIPGGKLRSGQLEPFEWIQLDRQIKRLYDAPLYIDDSSQLTIFEFQSKARRLKSEHNVELIMIDYLQLMNAGDVRVSNRQEEVSMISRALKSMAKELNIPIIALSQVNRDLGKREGEEGKRPQLTDLRESGAIEQDADMVCFIHRPEYYHLGGEEMKGKAVVIIAKHRNGAVGDVTLSFKKNFASFKNLDNINDSIIPSTYNANPEFSAAVDSTQAPPPDFGEDPFAGSPGEAPF